MNVAPARYLVDSVTAEIVRTATPAEYSAYSLPFPLGWIDVPHDAAPDGLRRCYVASVAELESLAEDDETIRTGLAALGLSSGAVS